MSSNVELIIADRNTATVVASEYIGGNRTVDKIREVLKREPSHTDIGFESWGQIEPSEMLEINEARYAGGPEPGHIKNLGERFPFSHYMWCLVRSY